MKNRYERNMVTLSSEENEKLKDFKICVIGCGGLGGYVIEMLARLGIGTITAVDGDVFDVTNLNRQILSLESNLGEKKALVAKERIAQVNSQVKINAVTEFFVEDNANEIIKGHDIVVDALDNMKSRRILERACEVESIPLVHGAIAGWYGQVSVTFPGDRTFEKIFQGDSDKGAEVELGNPAFTPAVVAAMEVTEVIKILFKREGVLRNKLLTIDLLNHEHEVMEI